MSIEIYFKIYLLFTVVKNEQTKNNFRGHKTKGYKSC